MWSSRSGDYLVHPDRTREFGALLGNTNDWRRGLLLSLQPCRLAARIHAAYEQNGPAEWSGDRTGTPGRQGVVGGHRDGPTIRLHGVRPAIQKTSSLVGLHCGACAALLAVLLARSLTRPIGQSDRGGGSDRPRTARRIPVDASGETGVLARAFARNGRRNGAKTAALEHEVEEHRRTEAARDQLKRASACSAPPSNPPTMRSSCNRSTASSPAGMPPPSASTAIRRMKRSGQSHLDHRATRPTRAGQGLSAADRAG